ncbi:DNA-binding MarR family transcriptional regulator [Azospirillum agricola]|uniref:helix-turn-helix domain-containing protein n=1 Tax=Azospirillum agricola TaxID=1720247 RepID=UPI001AEA1A26|nr:helix-turn-helix domain-containing protein [Azospirillum agricola]MBP2233060.1 DNA-binding MarR family transcriptional regulator [Azospirillum agricola]
MERGDGGYMRVVAGMPDPANRLPLSAGRRLKEEERRALVARLRGQGWSYRRISDELNISYATVSRWLDGAEAAVPPLPPLPARLGAPRPSAAPSVPSSPATLPDASPPDTGRPSPALDHLMAQNHALLHRVEQLVAAEAAHQRALQDLEQRLLAGIEEQHRKLGDRLLDSVKSLLRKLLPG